MSDRLIAAKFNASTGYKTHNYQLDAKKLPSGKSGIVSAEAALIIQDKWKKKPVEGSSKGFGLKIEYPYAITGKVINGVVHDLKNFREFVDYASAKDHRNINLNLFFSMNIARAGRKVKDLELGLQGLLDVKYSLQNYGSIGYSLGVKNRYRNILMDLDLSRGLWTLGSKYLNLLDYNAQRSPELAVSTSIGIFLDKPDIALRLKYKLGSEEWTKSKTELKGINQNLSFSVSKYIFPKREDGRKLPISGIN